MFHLPEALEEAKEANLRVRVELRHCKMMLSVFFLGGAVLQALG